MNKQLAAIVCLGICFAAAAGARAESACETASTHLLDALDKGDYAGATSDFNDTMKTKLLPEKLGQIWPAVAQQFGERGTRDAASALPAGDFTIVLTPLHYGQTTIESKVTCDAQGKVAGFFIQPHH
ncbi:DUF3887 domain-containing protein [Dyella sp. 2RAB6]|uniref:DUF3887 domain-containing protein n=1 Tax=Dyella sp. 2RAB6 TaxID=3232992 RepID=UPI003F8F6AB6